MEKDGEIILNSQYTKNSFERINQKKFTNIKYFYILIVIIFLNVGSIIICLINRKESRILLNLLNDNILKYKEVFLRKISFMDKLILLYNKENEIKGINHRYNYSYKEYNEIINEKYIKEQNYFCAHQDQFYNQEFEDQIRLIDININNKKYQMYIYKKDDAVSNHIIKVKKWEENETNILLKGLNYYKNKYNIKSEDIYILDIGANIGWYSFCLGKYGYKILSFEPSLINAYILKKNYCLNKELNITIINKGLYNQEKNCNIYNVFRNIGDGMILCEEKKNLLPILKKNQENYIILTKLSNYINYLSTKNLVLIKMDVEGSEGKAIEGGIEIITKYQVPFIFMEFCPKFLRIHGTEPKELLKLFENNGYKISPKHFFDENHYSIEDIIKNTGLYINLYIVHSKIFK